MPVARYLVQKHTAVFTAQLTQAQRTPHSSTKKGTRRQVPVASSAHWDSGAKCWADCIFSCMGLGLARNLPRPANLPAACPALPCYACLPACPRLSPFRSFTRRCSARCKTVSSLPFLPFSTASSSTTANHLDVRRPKSLCVDDR